MHALSLAVQAGRQAGRQSGRQISGSENCVYILDPIQAARRDERDPRG
jgi:hypothetical protein